MAGDQGRTSPVVTRVTVANTSGLAIGANPKRTRIIFQNVSTGTTNNIAVAPVEFGDAVLNQGGSIMLAPLGSLILDDIVCTSGFNAISVAGAAELTIQEF